jgi:hypothetical protein
MDPKLKLALLAAVVLLGACKQKVYEGDAGNARIDSASAAKMADTTGDTQKLVKTAGIRLKVKNVEQTGENVSALVASYKGMVMHHNMSSSVDQSHDVRLNNDSFMRVSSFTTSADMTVKVPVEKVDEFLNTVSHMGIYVNERRMDIEDKSLDYIASQLKLNSLLDLVARQKAGKVVIKDPAAVLNLKDDLVDEQISNRRINDEVKYSTISLEIYQSNTIYKETVVNDDPSAYDLPFGSRLTNALDNGWHLLGDLIIGLVNLWALIVCGIVICVIIAKRKMWLKSINS